VGVEGFGFQASTSTFGWGIGGGQRICSRRRQRGAAVLFGVLARTGAVQVVVHGGVVVCVVVRRVCKGQSTTLARYQSLSGCGREWVPWYHGGTAPPINQTLTQQWYCQYQKISFFGPRRIFLVLEPLAAPQRFSLLPLYCSLCAIHLARLNCHYCFQQSGSRNKHAIGHLQVQ
jgi:hypothetical protein